jgi:hypothetical protein
MKSRALWIILALAVLGTIAMAFLQRKTGTQATSAPKTGANPSAAVIVTAVPRNTDAGGSVVAPSSAPAMTTATNSAMTASLAPASASTEPKPVVAIQDSKTINFSSGQPMILDTDKDNAALAKALKEMEEATKDLTIPPKSQLNKN